MPTSRNQPLHLAVIRMGVNDVLTASACITELDGDRHSIRSLPISLPERSLTKIVFRANARSFRRLERAYRETISDLDPVLEEDKSTFVGLLRVEAA